MTDITISLAMQDGTTYEIEVTPEQALDFNAGHGLPFHFVHDERILVDADGTITERHSAIPPPVS